MLSGYAIDRHEVTAEAYRACVTAGVCPLPRSSSIAQYASYEDLEVKLVLGYGCW